MGSDEPIIIPLWAILLLLLMILIAVAGVILFVAALSSGVAVLLRRSNNDWIHSRAIASMSFKEVVIAIAAATTGAAPLGITIGLYKWSFIAFGVTTWIVSLPISAVIVFDRADTTN